MARILGIELDDNLRIVYALTKIKGVGWSLSRSVLKRAGIDEGMRVKDLSNEDISKIVSEFEGNPLEGDLIRKVRESVSRLKNISSYRGIRHARGLPSRGQKTRRNARTKRGKRKTVGAFKKEALSKMQQQKTKEEK
jgi:small subunit ribosomal protein S13